MTLPHCDTESVEGTRPDRFLDRVLQSPAPALVFRRQHTDEVYATAEMPEIGDVKTDPIHFGQAAELSHQAGPPQSYRPSKRDC